MCTSRAIGLLWILSTLIGGTPAFAQYVLVPPAGGQPATGAFLQEGRHLPLPAVSGVFLGGTSGTWPPLPIRAAPTYTPAGPGTVQQTQGTPAGGAIVLPPAVLGFAGDGFPNRVGVYPSKPSLFQVATTASFQWPAATATLGPGGGPGTAVFQGPGDSLVTYSGGAKAFGGVATFALQPGPGAGTREPPGPGGKVPLGTFWGNAGAATPSLAAFAGVAGIASSFAPRQGGPGSATSSFGAIANGLRTVNAPAGGGLCTRWCVGPSGTILSSGPGAGPYPGNALSASQGFPFTTGMITISVPSATPAPELLFLTGSDARVSGVGSISLVSASVGRRTLTGPSGNRAWVRLNLPEPGSLAGSAGALALLALCCARSRCRA